MVRFEKRRVLDRSGRVRFGASARWFCLVAGLGGCGTNNTYFQEYVIVQQDAGAPAVSAAPAASQGGGGGLEPAGAGGQPPHIPEGGVQPLGGLDGAEKPPLVASGAPAPDVKPDELALNVFGAVGNHFYFEASEEQVEAMNAPYLGGGYGDIYSPYGGTSSETFVDHLFITSAGEGAHTADFGTVQVRLVGQSTGR